MNSYTVVIINDANLNLDWKGTVEQNRQLPEISASVHSSSCLLHSEDTLLTGHGQYLERTED